MIQEIIAYSLVIVAAFFTLRTFLRQFSGAESPACSGCKKCTDK